MRIWDLPPEKLCDRHLLGEHTELHAIWAILVKNKKGYSRHPETLRWRGKLRALYRVHEAVAGEMAKRGFRHESPLDARLARGRATQDEYLDIPEKQITILKRKRCGCRVWG